MGEFPRFSVIVPTRNRFELLIEAIESIQRQEYRDFEIVIVDDFSDSFISEKIGGIDKTIRVIRQPMQSGPSAARNAGIGAALGDYVAFLDDDDLWMPWTLATYAEAIARNGAPAWLTSNGLPFENPREIATVRRDFADERVFADYLAYRTNPDQPGWLLPTGVVIRRDLLNAVGGFDVGITHHEDEDLWLRLGVAPGFIRIASPMCWGYRSHLGGASLNVPRRFINMSRLIEKERQGGYPGGGARMRERVDVISQLGRHLARLGAKEGYSYMAWAMYRRLLRWNISRSRWVFVLGFPAELIARASARFGRKARSGTS
jgi:glycosyltransferase involved in cell wall biosynthesis